MERDGPVRGKVCSVIGRAGVWVLGLVAAQAWFGGLLVFSIDSRSTATLSLPLLVDTHQSPLITFPPTKWNLLEVKDSLTHVSSSNTHLYQESCSLH